MKQSDLAAALGLDPAAVSRLKQRGMPTDSVEAAKAWRQRNVNPYYKGLRQQRAVAERPAHSPPPPAHPPSLAQPPATADLSSTVGAMEAVLESSAVMPHTALLAVVEALAVAALELLNAGRPLGSTEPALRAALSAVPTDLREQVAVPLQVYVALCAEAVAFVESGFASPEERELDRQAFEAGGDAAAAEMGRFWYAVAAGEYGVPD